jgi:hypothetical protein
VVAIAKGRASVSYVRIRSGETDRPSNNAPVTVVGDILRPAAPGFVGVTGDTLDPGLNFYTVSIPYYPGRQPGDHLYIVFEGLDASNTPYDFDDNAYVGSEPDGQPVLRNVDKAEIKKLDGGSLTVYYWINSQRRSVELQLSVGSGQPEMEKPDVIEADSNDVLDPDKVNPDVGPNVIVPYTGTVPNDIIGLRWRGSLSSPPDDERPLNTSSAGKPVPFTVPYRYVIDNLNGTVDVDYYLKRGSEPLRYSRVRPLTIGAAMNLTAPSVKEAGGTAPNQQLNPVAGKDNLTVVIPDYGVQPGDQVSVTWAGTAGDGSYTTPVQVLPSNREIVMPVSVIAYNLDKPVTVTYTVTRGSESPPSDSLNLAVQAMPQASLTIPLIPQAAQGGIGSELDLGSFAGDARVTVAPWPLIAAGQRVWLSCEGVASDGSDYTIPLYAGSEVSSSQVTAGLSTSLARSELEKLRDGSELKVVLLVTLNRTSNQSEAITFPLRSYTVRASLDLLPPRITSVEDLLGNEIPDGASTTATRIILRGKAASNQKVQTYAAVVPSPGETDVDADGNWERLYTDLFVYNHSFTAKALYGSNLVSARRFVSVERDPLLTITSVKDPQSRDIPNGGTTTATTLTLSGNALSNQMVEIMDGNFSCGTAGADSSGRWERQLSGLMNGNTRHSFKLYGLYGKYPSSNVHDVIIR